MWNQIENTEFYLKFNEYNVLMTDFVTLWIANFTKSEFLTCLQDSNPTLEIEADILIEKGKKVLLNPNKLRSVETNQEEKILNVSLLVNYGYLFIVKLKLMEAPKDLFFEMVTQPLLKVMQELKSSETQLRLLLKKKDKEIEEYKLKGGEIALVHLKTIPFNDEAHMANYRMYEEQFGSDVPEELLKRPIKTMNRIKEEPDTQVTSTLKAETNATQLNRSTNPNSEVKTEISSSSTIVPRTIVPSTNENTLKVELKTEPISQSELVSPKKRLKRKLNI